MFHKYKPFPPIDLPNRTWPSKQIEKAPIWCSVDLRDGNQSLIEPMGPERKQRMFDALVKMGFKQIEVGFPAASGQDFDFIRRLIDQNLIPEGVAIQVLTQCREELIKRTFEAIKGAKDVIIHIYNSTSTLQRKVVFALQQEGITEIAVKATELVKSLAEQTPQTRIQLEYSPESFTGTELDFAKSISEAVMDRWQPTPENKLILNLPATVEMSTPNVYADQIEWIQNNIRNRENIIISVHPHNDRGTGVAAAELALMAGADRVEGTLFGNGERTGNVDVITLALNMETQGIDSGLSINNINELVQTAEYCNRLPVHPRHPYAGELVFTAFSGSHQDAIRKGLAARDNVQNDLWEVPYLPVDPSDIGRNYEAVIRINSQSGKSGVGYILEQEYGYFAPKRLLIELSRIVQAQTESEEAELLPKQIFELFEQNYLAVKGPIELIPSIESISVNSSHQRLKTGLKVKNVDHVITGEGNGPLHAFCNGLRDILNLDMSISSYSEHSMSKGPDAQAAAYVEVVSNDEQRQFGVGLDTNIAVASLKAVVNALNKMSLNN